MNQGTGELHGPIAVPSCRFTNDGVPQPFKKVGDDYHMNSTFVVGEPIDANPIIAPGFPANQMIIRVQNSGQRIESADALMFWVQDSAEVARCIQGTADSNPSKCVLGPNGEKRLLVGMTSESVFASFVLNAACPSAYVAADALGSCADGSCPDIAVCPGRGSWIQFSEFGSKATPDQNGNIGDGFRVGEGGWITAPALHVELCDTATVEASLNRTLPIPVPNITGTLDGSFSFKLERRQGSQPFP